MPPNFDFLPRAPAPEAFEGERIRHAPIHPVGRAGLVENSRHAVVNRLECSIGGPRNAIFQPYVPSGHGVHPRQKDSAMFSITRIP